MNHIIGMWCEGCQKTYFVEFQEKEEPEVKRCRPRKVFNPSLYYKRKR